MPLDKSQVRSIYKTPEEYVRAVITSVARLVAEGFIVREDGDALVADAMAEAPELLR